MEFKKSKIAPIIIIGMHRSGTTMITQFLEQLGLFVGAKLDPNHESLFFFDLNKWIFDVGISKVDYPYNLQLMNPNCKEEIVKVLDYHMSGPRKKKFLGKHRFKDIRDVDFKWGWKEPRNSYTLEYFRGLFPEAKVIHIYRNPIDSANSYMKRDIARRNVFNLTWKKKIKRHLLVADKYHQNFRLNNHEDGYSLWKEYVDKSFEWEPIYKDKMVTLRYEDFLDQPFSHLKELAQFCDLNTSDEAINSVIKNVDASRKYAFIKDAESVEFYNTIKDRPLMQRLNYNKILNS